MGATLAWVNPCSSVSTLPILTLGMCPQFHRDELQYKTWIRLSPALTILKLSPVPTWLHHPLLAKEDKPKPEPHQREQASPGVLRNWEGWASSAGKHPSCYSDHVGSITKNHYLSRDLHGMEQDGVFLQKGHWAAQLCGGCDLKAPHNVSLPSWLAQKSPAVNKGFVVHQVRRLQTEAHGTQTPGWARLSEHWESFI